MTGIIVRKRDPYPVFAGSLPSKTGGRRSLVLAGVDQDGTWDVQKEDLGAEKDSNEPVLFVPFGAVDYALSMRDLKEMVAGMRDRHLAWRDRQAPTPDLTLAFKNFAQLILDRANGRKQFFFKETLSGK